jgi:uncharacterized protein (UPF0332 family)
LEGSLKELAKYRMERAKEMLEAAEGNLNIRQYKTSINRSYYAVFHAMRALNILKGFDSSKHSGVIAFFNREYLKTEILDKALSVIIKNSSFLREKSDYDDFFIASKKEAETQVSEARIFLEAAETYLLNIEQEQ